MGGHGRSLMAAERITLLRLEESGNVIEINPGSGVSFNDLDDYLRSRLRGKKIVEVKIQECRDEGRAIIVIRSEK